MGFWSESLGLALHDVVDPDAVTEEERATLQRARAKVILAHLAMPLPRSWWQDALKEEDLPGEGILGMTRDLHNELKKLPELTDSVDYARLVALSFVDEATNAQPPLGQDDNVYVPEDYLAHADRVLAQRPELKRLGERIATAIEKLPKPPGPDRDHGNCHNDTESKEALHTHEGRGKSGAAKQSRVRLQLIPGKTVATSEEARPIPMGVDEECRYFADFLHEEGFRPELRTRDHLVFFKYEGKSYGIELDEQDEQFFRIVFPNFWPIDGEEERWRVLLAADYTNAKLKVAKVFTVEDNVFATIEMFLADPAHFKPVFARTLGALKNAAETFAKKMYEET
jgi:hypothetical protein